MRGFLAKSMIDLAYFRISSYPLKILAVLFRYGHGLRMTVFIERCASSDGACISDKLREAARLITEKEAKNKLRYTNQVHIM